MSSAIIARAPKRLVELEAVIERGQAEFVAVGKALLEIREHQLYRAVCRTFEEYCKKRWGWGAGRARQLTRAAQYATKIVAVTGGNAPKTERETRELMQRLDAKLLDALPPEELERRLEQERRLKEERRQRQQQEPADDLASRLGRIHRKIDILEREISGMGDEFATVPLTHLEALRRSLHKTGSFQDAA